MASILSELDVNVILNLFAILLLVAGAPRVMKASVYKARDEEKEKIVAMKEETIVALRQRLQVTEEDRDMAVADAQTVVRQMNELQLGFEGLKTRFAEQSRYTAEEAVKMFHGLLERHDRDAERRHKELMEVLSQITQGRRFQRDE